MRAVVCDTFDGLDALRVREIDPPAFNPTPEQGRVWGSVRIAVRAAGVNFADTLIIKGAYQLKPPLPFSPGLEISGEIMEVTPEVAQNRPDLKPGTRVMATVQHGGFAEQAIASADDVYPIPDAMDWVSAAGFPVVYGTSHVALVHKARLQAGETLLVHGAAGGVGLSAVEIGKRLGARVIATAGGPEKLAIAKQYGADDLIDYRSEDIRKRVKALTAGRGADVVYDPVGGDVFDASLRATVQGGRIVVVGFASGTIPQVPANIIMVKNIDVMGFYFGGLRILKPDVVRAAFDELLAWYAAGEIKPHVSHTFALNDVRAALETLSARRSTGKIVLEI